MFPTHPTLEDFAGLLHGTSWPSSSGSYSQIIRHLLSDCPVCRERLRTVHRDSRRAQFVWVEEEMELPEGRMTSNEFDYSRAFARAERAVSALLASESAAAEPLDLVLAEMATLPADEQARRVTTDRRFAALAAINGLIDRSHEVRYQDAEAMLHFANLARLAADACSPDGAENGLRLADLRARAWGQYGNALRVSGRLREAEEAFATAQRHRAAGTGDPMLHAWLLERNTPLAFFQGRFNDAIERCEEAGEIYRELGERHLLASTVVQKATATLYSGEVESAVRLLNQAIPLIDHEEDPHLLLVACHNLIRCYIDLGRPDQALQIYSEIKELYEEFEDPLIRLRAAWQEGQLLRDLGHLQNAEAILLRARKGYSERKLPYEAALVSLDLATVYVKQGRTDKLKRTVLEAVPIFHSLRVGLQTLAALLQLQKVADQEQQALELIRTLSARIEPLRRQRVEEN
jgi:pentatricopeptide repeat protein